MIVELEGGGGVPFGGALPSGDGLLGRPGDFVAASAHRKAVLQLHALGHVAVLETAVADEFGIEPAVTGMVDLLKEDAIHVWIDLRSFGRYIH